MATYTWTKTTSGDWTLPANWNLNSSYPQLSTDVANGPTTFTPLAPIDVNLNTNINLATLKDSVTLKPFNVNGTGTINFSSTGLLQATTSKSALTVNSISARISTGSNALKIQGDSTSYWKLTNISNSIYQIAVASSTAFAFDSANCLNISHPQYIFSRTSTAAVRMHCTGSGGTISKNLWSTTTGGNFNIFSNGTGPIKIGITNNVVVPINTIFTIDGTMPPNSDTNDNQLLDNIGIAGVSSFTKNGVCRWILSGAITGTALTAYINDGILQVPVSSLNSSSYTTVRVNSAASCFEISGSGTVNSTISIQTNSSVGPNNIGGVRAVSNSNITVSSIRIVNGGNHKYASGTNAVLTITNMAATNNSIGVVRFGGEGTVNLQFSMFAPAKTMTSLNKEDSGTLKMTTNDKVYTAPTNITAGTLWCDGYNRISQSSTVTVSDTAKLRTSAGGTTSLSVKALTLNAGSFVQVD
jgi:autotransporter-associated beta strand protein